MDNRALALLAFGAGLFLYYREAGAAVSQETGYTPFADPFATGYTDGGASDAPAADSGQSGPDLSWSDPWTGQVSPPEPDATEPPGDGGYQQVTFSMNGFSPSKIPAEYKDAIRVAEQRNGIPTNLLAALLWKESRFNKDAINTRKIETRAMENRASGIAQIIPRWHPTVDVWDPFASIEYAAAYLAQQYRRFGTWALALAAYNWGPEALAQSGIAKAPPETRDYYSTILAAVGMSTNVA